MTGRSRAVRSALRSLTVRGRCLLAAGFTCGFAGVLLHQRDLVRVAVLLIVLPLVAVAFAARTRFRLTCTRRLEPARIQAGDKARVVLRIENVSRLPTGLLLIEDTIPYLLGGRPRVVVNRLAPRRPIDVGYHVSGELRGRYAVGPLTVRLMDPFALCELPRAFATTDTLVVTPQVHALPTVTLGGEWGGAGHSTARAVATHGDDDVATREYRHGDDLRRIHWATTARRGELTVRREEQPWQSRGAILLDSRAIAHRGEGPASSLEWAVSAAASIGLHLAGRGFETRVVTDTGQEVSSAGLGASFGPNLLDVLALVSATPGRTLDAGLSRLRHHGEGLLIAVVGALHADDAERLSRLRRSAASVAIAFVLDARSWATRSGPPTDAETEHDRAVRLLQQSGWRTIEVHRGDALPDLWPQAARGGARATAPTDGTPDPAPVGGPATETGDAA
jgi:uncharacterized protein (DUF58 family)